MTKEQTPTIDDLIQSFKELHERTTKGEWKQGHSSHETVSVHPAKTDAYHVADFRHANDASFVDFVHKHDFVDSAVSFSISNHSKGHQ